MNQRNKKIFFTGCLHLGHLDDDGGIIKYSNRPFKSINEHDQALIDNFNAVVSNGDDVYILGDFAMGSDNFVRNMLLRLNGIKYLITGNHDKFTRNTLLFGTNNLFKWHNNYYELNFRKEYSKHPDKIILFHYPLRSWNAKHYNSIHLHAHSHNSIIPPPGELSLDVGVDSIAALHGGGKTEYRPIEIEEVRGLMDKIKNQRVKK